MAERPLPVLGEVKLEALADQIRQWADSEIEPADGWYVTDVHSAEFAARVLVSNREVIDAARAQAQAWHAQIDEWFEEETRLAQMAVAFAEHKLDLYARHHRKVTAQATLTLPSAKIRTRNVPGATVVVDMEAFVAWALVNRPGALRVKHEPIADVVAKFQCVAQGSKDDVKMVAIDDEGEIVPGLGWRPDRVTVTL